MTELFVSPVAVIMIDLDGPGEGCGSVTSRNLYVKDCKEFNAAIEAVELMVLNDACRDKKKFKSSKYLEDVRQVVADLGERYPSPEVDEVLSGIPGYTPKCNPESEIES